MLTSRKSRPRGGNILERYFRESIPHVEHRVSPHAPGKGLSNHGGHTFRDPTTNNAPALCSVDKERETRGTSIAATPHAPPTLSLSLSVCLSFPPPLSPISALSRGRRAISEAAPAIGVSRSPDSQQCPTTTYSAVSPLASPWGNTKKPTGKKHVCCMHTHTHRLFYPSEK